MGKVMRIEKYAAGLLAGLLMGLSWAASAQALPQIREFYFDTDPAAAPMQAVDAALPDVVDQLARQRTRGRRMVEATVQLAGIAAAGGRQELASSLFNEALASAPANTVSGRSVRWNMGWFAFRNGDHAGARQLWSSALDNVRGEPSWAPPTLALLSDAEGDTAEAVKWFAAAVRTEPQLWSDPANFERLLPAWTPAERQALTRIQQAWVAAPPAWP